MWTPLRLEMDRRRCGACHATVPSPPSHRRRYRRILSLSRSRLLHWMMTMGTRSGRLAIPSWSSTSANCRKGQLVTAEVQPLGRGHLPVRPRYPMMGRTGLGRDGESMCAAVAVRASRPLQMDQTTDRCQLPDCLRCLRSMGFHQYLAQETVASEVATLSERTQPVVAEIEMHWAKARTGHHEMVIQAMTRGRSSPRCQWPVVTLELGPATHLAARQRLLSGMATV